VKILVRATNWIGDAILSLPALRAIREQFPQALLAVLAKPWVAALYENESAIDRVILLETASGARDWTAKWNLVQMVRREQFDLAILFPNSFESAALVRFAGVKRIVGYARDGRSPLLTEAIAVPELSDIPKHERFYYLELLRRAGIINRIPEADEIRLDRIPEARLRGEAAFRSAGVPLPVVGVSPGAAYGGAKRWLPERFAESAARLAAERNASVAVFGSSAEKHLCDEVASDARGFNFAGITTLREFIDMTAACSLFLTNDSGAMHIASALGVPSITVFGPTDETATGPLGPLARVVREPVECAPCLKKECPIDHRCMTRVTTDHVIASAHDLISIS
jgi:heptosyltransferase-2